MVRAFDPGAWSSLISGWWESATGALIGFLPSLLLALLVLAAGWLVARLAQAIARWLLVRVGVDRASGSDRVTEALRQSGHFSSVSHLASRLLFWGLMLATILFALRALGVTAVADTIARLFGYLPQLFAAILIVAVGILVARVTRSVVISAAATAKLPQAARLGAAAGLLVSLLVVILALGQLGIDTALLVTLTTALVTIVGLSMGLAFALGARPLVTKILAGHFLRQTLPRGTVVQLDEIGGAVHQVGPVSTQLRRGDDVLVVPNDQLVDHVIKI